MERPRKSSPRDHFPEQRWSDFVRGLAEGKERQEMQAHLESGCEACRKVVSALELVRKVGVYDSAHTVPQEVVAHAQELFEPPPTAAWMDSLEPLLAELVSPAGREWQLAGVRSQAGGANDRLLYRAGDYSVDLALDAPTIDQAGEIVGQIANEQDRQEPLEGVLVQMVAGGRIVGETSTNRFGEFILDYPAKKNATLHLALKHRARRIDLPLKLGKTS